MIQRIQTVYLLVVAILMVIMMSSNIGHFYTDDSVISMSNLAVEQAEGVSDYTPWALYAILLVTAVAALGTVFLYKRRMLQIRICLFSMILLVAYYIVLGIFAWGVLKSYGSFTPALLICVPAISIILEWLAIRAIGKDEMLVKAYDRLR